MGRWAAVPGLSLAQAGVKILEARVPFVLADQGH